MGLLSDAKCGSDGTRELHILKLHYIPVVLQRLCDAYGFQFDVGLSV